jgi:hypothetical protein
MRRVWLAGAVCALGLAYWHRERHAILTWGATKEEACARLPGDDLLEAADRVSTRAVEIDAPASTVWPWITQMGPSPRGGAYTYDSVENLLGLNMHSTDRVLPEFQHPRLGETVEYGPTGCGLRVWSQSECWHGGRRMETGSGRSCSGRMTGGHG